jgi:hypothetical protein
MARFSVAPRILGMVLLAHALMLLGADEITTLERGGIRTIRSFDAILTLYGADPKPWLMSLPSWLESGLTAVFALPGWAVLAVTGAGLAYAFRDRN